MRQVLRWLVAIQGSAAEIYLDASGRLKHDKELSGFLKRLSGGELAIAGFLSSSIPFLKDFKPPQGRAQVVEATVEAFIYLREAMSRAGGAEAAECAGLIELAKWNGLFIHALHSVSETPQAAPALSAAQRQKRAIERRIPANGSVGDVLFRLRAIPPVWRERLLVVDPSGGNSLKSALSDEADVVTATDPNEAIERLRERYCAAIISEEELPRMDFQRFLKKISGMFPGIERRVIILYGGRGAVPAMLPGKVRRVGKAETIEAMRDEVMKVLYGP